MKKTEFSEKERNFFKKFQKKPKELKWNFSTVILIYIVMAIPCAIAGMFFFAVEQQTEKNIIKGVKKVNIS